MGLDIPMILNTNSENFTRNALSSKFFKTFALLLLLTLSIQSSYAKHLLIYGDSLSAAYGMDEAKGWVNLLSEKLAPNIKVTNASISGETSRGGLARLPITLDELKPDVVFLELGANDGLQGQSTKRLKQNLAAKIELIQATGATVALASISLPASYGPRYIDQFRNVYTELADEYEIPLFDLYQPSFVETPGYIQEDGLHPTEVTQPIVRDLVLEFLNKHSLL